MILNHSRTRLGLSFLKTAFLFKIRKILCETKLVQGEIWPDFPKSDFNVAFTKTLLSWLLQCSKLFYQSNFQIFLHFPNKLPRFHRVTFFQTIDQNPFSEVAIWAEAGSGPDKLLCHISEEQFHIISYLSISNINSQQAVL